MNYCKKCVQPDTRPGVYFNKDGICGACIYEDEKKNIDWDSRERELREIAWWAKQKAKENKTNYECVIGVSGGKDSTFQALYARDRLGLRVLLVNGEPDGLTEIGKKNIENLKQLGFDCISLRPNPKVIKKLIRKDFFECLNPIKVTEFSLWASAYIMADKFGVPLVIQGENDAFVLGVKKTGLKENDDALDINKSDTLASGWKRYLGDGVTEEDLFMYKYDEESIRNKGIKAVFLQYYAKEWSYSNNGNFAIKHGLTTKPKDTDFNDIGNYVLYAALDSDLNPVNQMLKYIKFGFGACTDCACYDMRDGLISRKEAIDLVKKYDGKCSQELIKKFCSYIDISIEEFWKVIDKFRGSMWKNKNGNWVLDNPIWEQ